MLKAAAERGVKVHIIVYKEVEAALTCNSQVRYPLSHKNKATV